MRLDAGNEKTSVCPHCGETTHTVSAPPIQEETFGRALHASGVEHDLRRGEVMETLEFIVGTDDRIDF